MVSNNNLHTPTTRRADSREAQNVLMVSDFFLPNTGGVELHMYSLAQRLLERGHKAGRCKLDPSLKAPCFQPLNPESACIAFNLNPCCLSLRHYNKVVVLTHAYGKRCGVRHMTGGLKVYYAPRVPIYNGATMPDLFGNFKLLRLILIRERITIVHAHQAFSVMGHEGIMHARTMGYRCVFTDHSLFGKAV